MHPPEEACSAQNDEMFCFAVVNESKAGTIYSDLTGRFPVQSFTGMQYIFVAYIYTKNAILIRAMPNRTDESMVKVFKEVYETFEERNWKPKIHILDNECSKAVKKFILAKNVNIQLVEPHNHRVNAAETAVKAAKYHLIAGLATIDKERTIQLWDKFLPQVEDTMNMIRTSQNNPGISAYEDLHGKFDFNRTPMAPVGTKGLAFISPDKRKTFAPHAHDVIQVDRAPSHYRLLQFWNPRTHACTVTGTYKLHPTHCRMPTISEGDQTIIAATELVRAWTSNVPKACQMKDDHARVIAKLTEIMNKSILHK